MALVNERARILANGEVGPNLYLMELAAPRIAASIEPGQFVHMKVPNMEAHILRPRSRYTRATRLPGRSRYSTRPWASAPTT